MTAVGGSIEEVNLAGRGFPVAADAESQRKLGGDENEFQANGDGRTGRIVKTKTGWMLDGLALEIDDSRNDQEYLQDLADGNDFVSIYITYASGITYQGRGTITGELQTSSQAQTGPVTLMGPGRLTPQ